MNPLLESLLQLDKRPQSLTRWSSGHTEAGTEVCRTGKQIQGENKLKVKTRGVPEAFKFT